MVSFIVGIVLGICISQGIQHREYLAPLLGSVITEIRAIFRK